MDTFTQQKLKEFDENFGDWIINDDVEFKDHSLSDKIKSFISTTITQAKEEALTKAIQLFEKYKDEPMTGRVIIIELKALRGDFDASLERE